MTDIACQAERLLNQSSLLRERFNNALPYKRAELSNAITARLLGLDMRGYADDDLVAEIDYAIERDQVHDLERDETDPCERGTIGCCVKHDLSGPKAACETW